MENPKLAVPSKYMTGAGKGTPDFERYEWFVSIMLFACEQIVALRPNDREWTATVVDQLRYHVAYLGDKQFGAVHYSPALRGLFSEALQKGLPNAV
jgi:hypothetical protein